MPSDQSFRIRIGERRIEVPDPGFLRAAKNSGYLGFVRLATMV
jgi:hypothetical protein